MQHKQIRGKNSKMVDMYPNISMEVNGIYTKIRRLRMFRHNLNTKI